MGRFLAFFSFLFFAFSVQIRRLMGIPTLLGCVDIIFNRKKIFFALSYLLEVAVEAEVS